MNKENIDEQLYDQAIYLIRKRENPEKVRTFLIGRGLNEEDAYIMLNDIIGSVEKENQRKAKRNLLCGSLICVAGVFLSVKMQTIFPLLLTFAGVAQFVIGFTQLPQGKDLK